jgi:hypothetical protein
VLRRALVLLPLLLLVACGGGDDPDVAATEDDPVAPVATVDWAARTIELDGDLPFDVRFCDGDAPLLCVTDGGAQLGVIELATFPSSAVEDFGAWASSFYASMRADRVEACDPGYELEGDDVAVDGEWMRYGFTGAVDGVATERVVGYARNDGSSLQLIVANALADDACLARESELPLGAMDDVEPLLAAIVAGSTF